MAEDESEEDIFAELFRKGIRDGSKDVRFDKIEDVLASSDLIALVAPLVKKKPSYWKWILARC